MPLGLPRGAKERVLSRYPSGAKCRSELRHRRLRVAEVLWEENGRPSWAWSLRGGKHHGPSVEWWDNGQVSFVEPWVDGLAHGVARHYDRDGELLLATRFVRGTGVDLWCDAGEKKTLSEETRLEGGHLRERRWWNLDQRTVWMEEHWADQGEHGIFREWTIVAACAEDSRGSSSAASASISGRTCVGRGKIRR